MVIFFLHPCECCISSSDGGFSSFVDYGPDCYLTYGDASMPESISIACFQGIVMV